MTPKYFIYTILLVLNSFSGISQQVNQMVIDEKSGQPILLGNCNRVGLVTSSFAEHFHLYYPIYKSDTAIIRQIKPYCTNIVIVIIMGHWCGDSQEQVPRFYSILDQLQFPEERVRLICVDRKKLAGDLPVEQYKIEKVPTFIFYKQEKELGRIIETPIKSLESDMLEIIKQQ